MAEKKDTREITGEGCSTAEDIPMVVIGDERPMFKPEDYSNAKTGDPLTFISIVCSDYGIPFAKHASKAYFQHLMNTCPDENKALDYAFYSCLMAVLEIPGNENKHDQMVTDAKLWLCHDLGTLNYIKTRDRIRDCQQELFFQEE